MNLWPTRDPSRRNFVRKRKIRETIQFLSKTIFYSLLVNRTHTHKTQWRGGGEKREPFFGKTNYNFHSFSLPRNSNSTIKKLPERFTDMQNGRLPVCSEPRPNRSLLAKQQTTNGAQGKHKPCSLAQPPALKCGPATVIEEKVTYWGPTRNSTREF